MHVQFVLELAQLVLDGVIEQLRVRVALAVDGVAFAVTLELARGLREVDADARDVVQVDELVHGLLQAVGALRDLGEQRLEVFRLAGAAVQALGEHSRVVVDGLLDRLDRVVHAREPRGGRPVHLEREQLVAGVGDEPHAADELVLELARFGVDVAADEDELDALAVAGGARSTAGLHRGDRVAQLVGVVGERDLLAEVGAEALHGGEEFVVVAREAQREVLDDDLAGALLGLALALVVGLGRRAAQDFAGAKGFVCFAGTLDADIVGAAAKLLELLAEAGRLAVSKQLAQFFGGLKECAKVLFRDLGIIHAVFELLLELFEAGALGELAHGEAHGLERPVGARSDSRGGAQPADGAGERVAELAGARRQAQLLDRRVQVALLL